MIELSTVKKILVGGVALIGATAGTVLSLIYRVILAIFILVGCGKPKRSLASGLVYSLDFLYT
jgi:hypothetical protein